jgi:hypothetical protein
VRALQAAPVRPVGKAFGVQRRVGHRPNVLHRLRTVLPGAAASQGAQSNDDTTAGEAAPPPRLIVSPPVPISQVGRERIDGRMPSSVPHLRRARRAASLRVQLRRACRYALYGHCVPVSRRIVPGLLPVRTCANGGGATSHTRPFGSARLKRASIDAATRAGAAAG